MSKIQETLDSLQPYVIGIRYLEGVPLVDVVFKEGWSVPEDKTIQQMKGNDNINYYMLYSEVKGVGLDELLAYVDKTIKLNIEREKKHELLKIKVDELKDIFKKHSLNKLKTLKFKFNEEDLVPNLGDFDLTIDDISPLVPEEKKTKKISETKIETKIEDEFIIEPMIDEPKFESPIQYLDENKNPIELTEEELEILEEEARAEKNLKYLQSKGKTTAKINNSNKVELPPKNTKTSETVTLTEYGCECGDHEACAKCMDKYE